MSCNFNEIFLKLQTSATDLTKKPSGDVSQDPEKKSSTGARSEKSLTDASFVSDVSLPSDKYFDQFLMKEGKIVNTQDVICTFIDGVNQPEPIEHIKQARFTKEIHDNLFRKGYRTVFNTQAYSWNAICEGRAVIIISQKRSGKTLAILPAVLSLLCDINLDEEVSEGPFAVFFTSSSQEVDITYELCRQMVHLERTTIVRASGKWNLKEVRMKLLNGCHLLITTVPCFLRLITGTSDGVKVFNREKLKHIIFDNVEDMHDKYKAQVIEVIKTCTLGIEKAEDNPQIVLTSTKWTDFMAKMAQLSCQPLIVFGDNIEAAIYAKTRFVISRVENKQSHIIRRLVGGDYRFIRTIVFVKNESDLEGLKKLCSANMIEFIALTSKTKTALNEVWKKVGGYMKVVLASDDAMINYTIRNAQIIIHYTLPQTWTIFSKRFVASFNHYKSYLASKKEDPKARPMSFVVMDMNNILEVPRMISLLRDHRLLAGPDKITEETLKWVDEITEGVERSKTSASRLTPVQLCSHFLKFAVCSSYKCPKRHVFVKEVDTPQFLPTQGQIKFTLIAVKNPIHYAIKISEVQALGSEVWVSWSRRNEAIEQELEAMQEILKDESNVHIQATIEVGDICAFYLSRQQKWYRAKVLCKEKTENSDVLEIKRGRVCLIDKGETMVVKLTQLVQLERRFVTLPPLVYDLRILNLVPYDCDTNFDNSIIREIEHLFSKKGNHGDFMVAKIAVTIQDTIFAKNFHVLKHLVNAGTHTVVMHLKEILLKKSFAVEDENIFEKFKRLAMNAGLELPGMQQIAPKPTIATPKPIKNPHADVVTSYVPLKLNTQYNVEVGAYKSPKKFYVMIREQYDKIRNVLCNIKNLKNLDLIASGHYCLFVADNTDDQTPYRAIIQNEQKIEILLLDTGCLKKCSKLELYEITKEVLLHPFTAVKCKLSGVKPKLKNNKTDWEPRDLAAFKHLITHLSTDKRYTMTVQQQISPGFFEVSLESYVGKKDLAAAAIKAKYADKEVSLVETKAEHVSKLETLLQQDEALFGTESDLMQLIGLPSTAKFIPQSKDRDTPLSSKIEKAKLVENNSQKKLQHRSSGKDEKASKKMEKLTQLYQHPQIDWYQNGAVVYLKVEFRDGLDYSIDLTETKVSVYLLYENIKKCAHLELYGSVQPKLSSHSRNNSNEITIRLVKRLINVEWPRLISCKEKNNFIQYRVDEKILETPVEMRNWYPADYFDDDEDSNEENLNPFDDQLEADGIF